MERTANNRGNAYFPPGALALPAIKDPTKFTLPSFDCANSGVKAPDATPGCFLSGPQTFQGKTQKFPQVVEGSAGGVSKQPAVAGTR